MTASCFLLILNIAATTGLLKLMCKIYVSFLVASFSWSEVTWQALFTNPVTNKLCHLWVLYFSLIFMLQGHETTNWTKICPKFTKSSELYVAGKFGKQNGLFTGVTKDFWLQSHFHVGVHTWKFRTPIIPIWVGCKVATKTFRDYYVPINIPRPGAFFQLKLPTGVHVFQECLQAVFSLNFSWAGKGQFLAG